MVARRPIGYFLGTLLSLLAQVLISSALPVSARPLAPTIAPTYRLSHFTSHHRSGRRAGRSRAVPAQPRQARGGTVRRHGARHQHMVASRHHMRHHGARRARKVTADRHAYPANIFMLSAPDFDRSPLPADVAEKIRSQFATGMADAVPARMLVRAGIVAVYPMHGGIYWRREPVQYIIVHSTETGRPVGATAVINGWSSGGRRHAGAQFVVDRDGTIFQAVDPDLATVHVNIFKTLPGINNDNSIGIEMVHAGRQDYPPEQRRAVVRLVTYLQDRYKVPPENIITHRYAQQGDHTDPVNFDWEGFLQEQSRFHGQALAARLKDLSAEIATVTPSSGVVPSIYMQIHGREVPPAVPQTCRTNAKEAVTASKVECVSTELPGMQAPQKARPAAAPARLMSPMPVLRGPIEMDPRTASLLNVSPVETTGGTEKQSR